MLSAVPFIRDLMNSLSPTDVVEEKNPYDFDVVKG